jgi:hypothetical protein
MPQTRFLWPLALALGLAACGPAAPAPATPTPSRTQTPRNLSDLPKQPDARVEIVATEGTAPGGVATVRARTTPEALCAIQYTEPRGLIIVDPALSSRPADTEGAISWRWTIRPESRTGPGKVKVSCNGAEATAEVPIG